MAWTEEREHSLKALWADGLSASQIAAELGGVTRNAVIGKVHRLGLDVRAKSPASGPRQRKASVWVPRTKRPSARRLFNTAFAPPAIAVEPVAEPEMLEIPMEQRKTLLQLDEKTCRWPVGDPDSGDFFFCGGDAVDGYSYCMSHCRVAYRPASDRSRAQRSWRAPHGGAAA